VLFTKHNYKGQVMEEETAMTSSIHWGYIYIYIYRIFVGKPERKRPMGRRRLENNNKTDVRGKMG
jgi:hypothetical protein